MDSEQLSNSDEMDFETQTDILTLLENVKCQTNNSSSQRQAFIALATIFNLGEDSQNYFKEAGGLKEIKKQLLEGSYELSMVPAALFCFACAIKDNETSKMEALSRDLLLVLHQILISVKDQGCLQAAAFLLSCLVSGNVQGQHLALETGCVKDLLRILRGLVQEECTNEKQWMTITRSLCACISDPQNENNQRVSCCVIPHALKVVSSWSDCQIIQHALTLMGLVIFNNGSNQNRFRSCGGIDTLTNLISNLMSRLVKKDYVHISVLISAISTLDFAVTENEPSAMHAVEARAIQHILNLFQNYTLALSIVRFPLLALAHLLEYADLSQDLTTTVQCQRQMVTFFTDTKASQDDELSKLIKYILALCDDKDIPKGADESQNANRMIAARSKNRSRDRESLHHSKSMDRRLFPYRHSSMPPKATNKNNASVFDVFKPGKCQSEACFETGPLENVGCNSVKTRKASKLCDLNSKLNSKLKDYFSSGKIDAKLLEKSFISELGCKTRSDINARSELSQVELDRSFMSSNDSPKAAHMEQVNGYRNKNDNNSDKYPSQYSHISSNERHSDQSRSSHRYPGNGLGFNPVQAVMNLQEHQIQMFSDIQVMISSLVNMAPSQQQDSRDLLHSSSTQCKERDSYQPLTSSPRYSSSSLALQNLPSLNMSMIEPNRQDAFYSSATPNQISLDKSRHSLHNVSNVRSASQQNRTDFSRACLDLAHGKSKIGMKQDGAVTQAKHDSNSHSGCSKSIGHRGNRRSLAPRSYVSNHSINILTVCDANTADKGSDSEDCEVQHDDDDDDTMVDEQNKSFDTTGSTIQYSSVTLCDEDGTLNASKGKTKESILSKRQREPDRCKKPRGKSRNGSIINQEESGKEFTSKTCQTRNLSSGIHSLAARMLVDINQSMKTKSTHSKVESKKSTKQTQQQVQRKELTENVRKVKSIASIHLSTKADILGESSHSSKPPSFTDGFESNKSFEIAIKALAIDKGKGPSSVKGKQTREKGYSQLKGDKPQQKMLVEDKDSGFSVEPEQDSDLDHKYDYRKNQDNDGCKNKLNREVLKPRCSLERNKAQNGKEEKLGENCAADINHRLYTPQRLDCGSLTRLERREHPAIVGDTRGMKLKSSSQSKRSHLEDVIEINEEDKKRQKIAKKMVVKEVILSPQLRSEGEIKEDQEKDLYDFTSGSEVKHYPSTPGSDISKSSLRRSLRKKRLSYNNGTRRIRLPYSDQEVLNLRHGVATLGTRWQQIIAIYQFHTSRTAVDLKEKFQRLMDASRSKGDNKFPSLPFSVDEIKRLKRGVKMFGHNWTAILAGERFLPGRTAQDLRNKWRVLSKDLFNSSI